MEMQQSGVICTKHKLWKKKKTVMDIIDTLQDKGYIFEEMIYGEPNDFIFTEKYDDVVSTLSRPGSFFGIRIKFKSENYLFSIESNTMGIDNVRYDIYAEDEILFKEILQDCLELEEVIGPSSDTLAKGTEFFGNNTTIAYVVIAAMLVILFVLLS